MRTILALLTLLFTLLPAQGAAATIAGGIFYSTDTTGTNARASRITISPSSAGTNLMAGSATITNLLTTATGGGSTFLVAAVDSPTRIFAQADYQCDGTADDVQINAAIVAAYTHGGDVVLAPGNYSITSSISITNGVSLRGWGSDAYFFDFFGTTTHRCKVVAATAGMTMVLATPSTSLLTRPLVGMRLRGIEFDGAGIANIGVRVESAYQPIIEDVGVMYCTNHCMLLCAMSNTNYSGLIHTYQPFLKNVVLNNRTTNSGMAFCNGLTLDGDLDVAYAQNGSTTLGTFENLSIAHGNGAGINIVRGDTHTFINPTLTRSTGGTGVGVALWDAASHSANQNVFIGGYVGAGGVYSHGTNTAPAIYNHWYGYALSDLAPLPTIQAGSSFYYDTMPGTNFIKHTATEGISYTGTGNTLGTTTMGRPGWMATPWLLTNGTMNLLYRKAPQIWEFAAGNGEWTAIAVNSGTGTAGSNFPAGNDPGAIVCNTTTSTNAVAGFRTASGNMYFNSSSIAVHWRIETGTSLSTDADGYEIIAGFGDTTTDANMVDGVYFRYNHSLSNGVWTGMTANNSVTNFASGASSTVTVAINTVYDLLIEATSSVANFWISTDNGATYTWTGFTTSTIPQAVGRETAIEAYIRKLGGSVGTTSRLLYLGRCELWPN